MLQVKLYKQVWTSFLIFTFKAFNQFEWAADTLKSFEFSNRPLHTWNAIQLNLLSSLFVFISYIYPQLLHIRLYSLHYINFLIGTITSQSQHSRNTICNYSKPIRAASTLPPLTRDFWWWQTANAAFNWITCWYFAYNYTSLQTKIKFMYVSFTEFNFVSFNSNNWPQKNISICFISFVFRNKVITTIYFYANLTQYS